MNPVDYTWESAHNVKIALRLSDYLLLPRSLIGHFAIVCYIFPLCKLWRHEAGVWLIRVRREKEKGSACVGARVEEMSGVSREISFGLAGKENLPSVQLYWLLSASGDEGFCCCRRCCFPTLSPLLWKGKPAGSWYPVTLKSRLKLKWRLFPDRFTLAVALRTRLGRSVGRLFGFFWSLLVGTAGLFQPDTVGLIFTFENWAFSGAGFVNSGSAKRRQHCGPDTQQIR